MKLVLEKVWVQKSSSIGMIKQGKSMGSDSAIKKRKVSLETVLADTSTAICTVIWTYLSGRLDFIVSIAKYNFSVVLSVAKQ